MSDRSDAIAENGLRFFGKVTASLSHEFRNVLATIYENAGLLEDLALLAEKGRPLDLMRVRNLAGKVKAQVRRGNEIAESMNRFAHSSDEPRTSVNVVELLELVVSLGRRMALMHGLTLQAEHRGNPVVVRTDPFVLENLVWLCLELGMGPGKCEKDLTVVSEPWNDGGHIRLKGLQGLEALKEEDPPIRKLAELAEVLGVEMTLDRERGEILISIPRNLMEG